MALRRDVDEVHGIMRLNIKKVLSREVKLEDLLSKAQDLEEAVSHL